jgi:hypothetical protein
VHMGSKNLQEKLLALGQAVHAGCIATVGLWPKDPIHGKTSKGSSGLKTTPSKHHLEIKCILLEEKDYSLNLLLNMDSGVYLQGKLCVQTYSLSNIQNGVLKGLKIGSVGTLCVHFSDLFIFFSFQFFFFPPLHLSYIMYLLKMLDLYGMLYFV